MSELLTGAPHGARPSPAPQSFPVDDETGRTLGEVRQAQDGRWYAVNRRGRLVGDFASPVDADRAVRRREAERWAAR